MEIKDKIEKWVKENLGRDTDFTLVHPKELANGDFSLIVSDKTAEKDFEKLEKNKLTDIEKIALVNPRFINIYLSKEFFKNSLEEIVGNKNFGKSEHSKGFKVMVEHTQPNPFKKFHIGHLMNNAIGEALARIIKANGAEVRTASYHGDIGMHVAKALWKGDYAVGAQAYEKDPQAKKEIQEINKKVYDKSDQEINQKYETDRRESLEEFEKIYEKLDTKFDYNFFESETADLGKQIVLENLGKVFKESEGAIVFEGEKYGLHTRVFLTSDKLPTYEAKEIGLAKIKQGKFNFDQSVTITGNEQDAFFNVVEVAVGEVFPELKGKLKHLSHGMLRLPSGKMSSRTGDVITAEELIEDVKKKVKDDEAVAIGAIKYMILRQAIGNDIVFNIDKSVSTDGDSGVYLQYAYARTNSLLEKAKSQGLTLNTNSQGQTLRSTHEIERLLYRFPEVVERAGEEYAPHYITTYLTELAGSFNNFYAHEEILGDSPESSYRLAIAKAFNIVMKNGLILLGIPAPERM